MTHEQQDRCWKHAQQGQACQALHDRQHIVHRAVFRTASSKAITTCRIALAQSCHLQLIQGDATVQWELYIKQAVPSHPHATSGIQFNKMRWELSV